ncbi:MAG: type II toxin-antitoxin system HicB family antitoxin [Candidatus Berkelbacteria bacterium]|nr:type II toxin-antitoxin system HicB family antitoxin [Candidatus Berkelbacteria bacterium]MCR4307861.1 type II toxin-antitoxin system HicB family antitoxin [Candidatus Berkelbacteria bacterium]
MKAKATSYTTVINREKRLGTEDVCYTAYVPVLGVATEANTADEAQKAIEKLVNFHLESLTEEGTEVPIESPGSLVTTFRAQLPAGAKISR